MDHQRDYLRFRGLLGRLCETMGKPCTDELVESWWKALRNAPIAAIEARIDAFIAKATDGTRFPRPAQMRPENLPEIPTDGIDWSRNYWRSVILANIAGVCGHTDGSLEPMIVEDREPHGAAVRALLDTLDEWEKRANARSDLMRDLCEKGCIKIASQLVAESKHGYHRPSLVGPRELRYSKVPRPVKGTRPPQEPKP